MLMSDRTSKKKMEERVELQGYKQGRRTKAVLNGRASKEREIADRNRANDWFPMALNCVKQGNHGIIRVDRDTEQRLDHGLGSEVNGPALGNGLERGARNKASQAGCVVTCTGRDPSSINRVVTE